MSRIGSCEEALLLGVGDGGEVPVRAGAPTAAEEAGAERAVPSLCGYRARGRGHSVRGGDRHGHEKPRGNSAK